jgi:hypothetical protein
MKATRLHGPGRWQRWLAAATMAMAAATPALAQYADLDRADWREDPAPPPPAYSTSGLVEIEMPRGSSVKMGVDPSTITINLATGIVRYVVVAHGPSAVNASYEGIRCATGEYKVYARQTQGNPWSPSDEDRWKAMRGQTGVVVSYPYRLARDGMCVGNSVRHDVADMVRELRSGNRSLYY